MRYLTKDWYLRYIQVEWIKTLRVVFHTEYFSEQRFYVWQEEDMYSPFSKMVGAEIEYGNDKFILRLLILNDNGFEEFTLAETLFECEGIYWVEK